MNGLLITADGAEFSGVVAGADGIATGEAVFNTSMFGYQEIVTDPSYAGQVVVMTTAHVGNYGVTPRDEQAETPKLRGLVMRSLSPVSSNWRAEATFADYLVEQGIVALTDVDTRRLTRHLREHGAMPVAMGPAEQAAEIRVAAASAPGMEGAELASAVSTNEPYRFEPAGTARGLVVAVDLGMKRDIAHQLVARRLAVQVVPATAGIDAVLEYQPDAVLFSNGPGDPEPLLGARRLAEALLGRLPIYGICLGHQVLGLALGATTTKLPFGHHGGNHPVIDVRTGRVLITAQNHGFAVEFEGDQIDSPFGPVVATHINLNDRTLEGFECQEVEAAAVQFHPEAAPGPTDAHILLDRIVEMVNA